MPVKIFLQYGLKINFSHQLGSILFGFFWLLGAVSLGGVLFLLAIGTSVSELFTSSFAWEKLLTALSFEQSPLWAICCILLALFFFLYHCLIQAMAIGGLYGSAIHAIFNEQATISAYFSYCFRNLGRLTRLQLLLFTLFAPCFIVTSVLVIGMESVFDTPNIIYFQISFAAICFLLFCTLFLHSPILIIKNQVGAWQAIWFSLRLLPNGLYPILFSAVVFFTILALVNGLFLAAIFALLNAIGPMPTGWQFDMASLEWLIVSGIGLVLWLGAVLPYSIVCALLVLVKRYKDHLYPLATEWEEDSTTKGNVS